MFKAMGAVYTIEGLVRQIACYVISITMRQIERLCMRNHKIWSTPDIQNFTGHESR